MNDVTCEHGTAMDVHCCNCHSGFLFDVNSCVCEFEREEMENKTWQEDVVEVERKHKEFVKIHGKLVWNGGRKKQGWSVGDTAKKLEISKGKVSTDLRLAAALKKYKEISEMEEKRHAIGFLKVRGVW